MAAPSVQTRDTPAGIPQKEGHGTKIAMENDSNIEFWEVEVQPMGIDGGAEINMINMHLTTWEVFRAKTLKRGSPFTVSAQYDQMVYVSIMAQINQEQTLTVIHPDTSTTSFFGWMQNFDPQPNVSGQAPLANITFVPSSWDPTNNVEAGPAIGTA